MQRAGRAWSSSRTCIAVYQMTTDGSLINIVNGLPHDGRDNPRNLKTLSINHLFTSLR